MYLGNYGKREDINSRGNSVAHVKLLQETLPVLLLPEWVAVIHVPGHAKGTSKEARGNRMADTLAKEAAVTGSPTVLSLEAVIPMGD